MQMQMESQQASHANRLEEANAERDRLTAHLSSALDSCRQLEADLQHSRCAFVEAVHQPLPRWGSLYRPNSGCIFSVHSSGIRGVYPGMFAKSIAKHVHIHPFSDSFPAVHAAKR